MSSEESGALSAACGEPKERLTHTPGRTLNRIRSTRLEGCGEKSKSRTSFFSFCLTPIVGWGLGCGWGKAQGVPVSFHFMTGTLSYFPQLHPISHEMVGSGTRWWWLVKAQAEQWRARSAPESHPTPHTPYKKKN